MYFILIAIKLKVINFYFCYLKITVIETKKWQKYIYDFLEEYTLRENIKN